MALDTRNKRASALGVAVATFALVLPNPDGLTLDQGDRQQTAFVYRGILARLPILHLPETIHLKAGGSLLMSLLGGGRQMVRLTGGGATTIRLKGGAGHVG